MQNGEIDMLVECKKYGEPLSFQHASQLFRYFSVTNVRVAMLTNGAEYHFFTDLDKANQMDEKPFLMLNLENIDEYIIPEIKRLTKTSFDVNSIVDSAGELKYLNQIKNIIAEQFRAPEEDFVTVLAKKVYERPLTAKTKLFFTGIVEKACKQFLNESINDRLKSAIIEVEKNPDQSDAEIEGQHDGIVTTEEELEGFRIVRAILSKQFSPERIIYKDAKNYFSIFLTDGKNEKLLCRFYFQRSKVIKLFNKQYTIIAEYVITDINEMYQLADAFLEVGALYLEE